MPEVVHVEVPVKAGRPWQRSRTRPPRNDRRLTTDHGAITRRNGLRRGSAQCSHRASSRPSIRTPWCAWCSGSKTPATTTSSCTTTCSARTSATVRTGPATTAPPTRSSNRSCCSDVARVLSLELVTDVLVAPQRQTALLAKQVATLAPLAPGRVRLGVGIGWNDVEYQALGVDFRRRAARMEEQIPLLRQLWTEPSVDHTGMTEVIDAAGLARSPREADPDLDRARTDSRAVGCVGRLSDGWLPEPTVQPGRGFEPAWLEVRAAASAGVATPTRPGSRDSSGRRRTRRVGFPTDPPDGVTPAPTPSASTPAGPAFRGRRSTSRRSCQPLTRCPKDTTRRTVRRHRSDRARSRPMGWCRGSGRPSVGEPTRHVVPSEGQSHLRGNLSPAVRHQPSDEEDGQGPVRDRTPGEGAALRTTGGTRLGW